MSTTSAQIDQEPSTAETVSNLEQQQRQNSQEKSRKSKTSMRSLQILNPKSTSRIKARKSSFGFSSITGLRLVDRSAVSGHESKRPVLTYLPTYQIDSYFPFNISEVEKIANKVIDVLFTDHKYNTVESPQLAMCISFEVMRRVKEKKYNRYRIIAVATVGQKRAQSYNNAIAFLWDYERDRYVDVHRENASAFVQVTVFGVYLD